MSFLKLVMVCPESKHEIIERLQKEILSMQGLRLGSNGQVPSVDLGPIERAFPDHTFPVAAVHEFLSSRPEDAAATSGFLSGILGHLMKEDGVCLWIGVRRTVFPPALKAFGIEPDRITFIDLGTEKDVLWTVEEALKCEAVAAVVGELKEISLTESRRLQLAVEKSRVTGLLHRQAPRRIENNACVSRWQISSIPSEPEYGMPGVGLPRWNVELLKIRNGRPGVWQIEWSEGRFRSVDADVSHTLPGYNSKTG